MLCIRFQLQYGLSGLARTRVGFATLMPSVGHAMCVVGCNQASFQTGSLDYVKWPIRIVLDKLYPQTNSTGKFEFRPMLLFFSIY